MTTSSRIFDVVQAMSGQKNVIIIPRPYLQFFSEDQLAYPLAAVLNQIVFWSGVESSCGDGWFYKSHEEMGADLEVLSPDQIGRLVKKICLKYLPGIIETKTQKVNGTPTTHYRILDNEALIAKIFPQTLDSAKVRNGKRKDAKSKTQHRGMENANPQKQCCESAESYLYTDLNADKDIQIIKPSCQPASPADGEEFIAKRLTKEATEVVEHLSKLTGVTFELTDSNLQHVRARMRNATATKTEMLVVVDHLVACWLGTRFSRGLNPSTIFSSEKFSSNLLAAKAWNDSGRPACSSEPAVAASESLVNTTERDEEYNRYMKGYLLPNEPSDLAIRVSKAADSANLRSQSPSFAISRWNSIWKEQAQRGNQGAAA